MNKYKEVLDLFRGDPEEHVILASYLIDPAIKGKVCATNGDALAVVPAFEVETKEFKLHHLLKRDQNIKQNISVGLLKESLENCKLEAKKCSECNDEGMVDFHYFSSEGCGPYFKLSECPFCDGTKYLPLKRQFAKIGVCIIDNNYLKKLVKAAELLKAPEIELTSQTDPLKASFFKIANVEIVLMPIQAIAGKELPLEFEIKVWEAAA